LTLGGGGTDDPTFAAEHGGYAITAAIDKYVFIGVSDTFTPGYFLKYSETEHVQTIDEIQHPILREALRYFDIPPHVEIVSLADIPGGTGLGSSAAFTVGLCKALSLYRNGYGPARRVPPMLASFIELDLLERPGGCQDHWATALGGVSQLRFDSGRFVDGRPLKLKSRNLALLESSLLLFFTGYSRDADTVLTGQTHEGLSEIKRLGIESAELIRKGKIAEYGSLMDDHWWLKRLRHPAMSNATIDHWYDVALDNGAVGGKLVGAGGGGFLLFVVDDKRVAEERSAKDQLRTAMACEGLQEVPFKFDRVGTTVIAS
jgi:D-glycero-alpha-D-manno-heptose-7-phosphate kinase